MNLSSYHAAKKSLLRLHSISWDESFGNDNNSLNILDCYVADVEKYFNCWVDVEICLNYLLSKQDWEFMAVYLLYCLDTLRKYSDSELVDNLVSHVLAHIFLSINHSEPRVRTIAVEIVGILSIRQGTRIFDLLSDYLMYSFQRLLERTESTREVVLGDEKDVALDDTTGWKSLETSFRTYISLIRGCGSVLIAENKVSEDVFNIYITQTSTHINRYIREACYEFIIVVLELFHDYHYNRNKFLENGFPANMKVEVGLRKDDDAVHKPNHDRNNYCNEFYLSWDMPIAHIILDALSIGLDDNWGQVRHVAIRATRAYLFAFSTRELEITPIYSILLPRILLNRFYVAEGIKLYAQETWRLITRPSQIVPGREVQIALPASEQTEIRSQIEGMLEESVVKSQSEITSPSSLIKESDSKSMMEHSPNPGVRIIIRILPDLVSYYISKSRTTNHMISEAACYGLSEIISRIPPTTMEAYVPSILSCLYSCSCDDSWPIRDAGSVALATTVSHFPAHALTNIHSYLCIWQKQLSDPIWSIRENAAVAIREVLSCGHDVIVAQTYDMVEGYLRDNIKRAVDELTEEQKRKRAIQFLPPETLHVLVGGRAKGGGGGRNGGGAGPEDGDLNTTGTLVKQVKADWGCCMDCTVPR